ncbi:hypothetical protein [Anabaena azotica]|uniref:Uncharacterized protein n=1 Tax=Anabaena azotica FACHB-119 TaxID=947527 RepID=A0ABR8DEL3_9NOST|nr:hypothetical protein [Anabaena azotica]MBD2504815.1 hypothetical protein [Anabaena azotica FACHB-119]
MQTCSFCGQLGHNKRWHDISTEKQCRHCNSVFPISEFRTRVKTLSGGNRRHYTSNICSKCDAQRCKNRYRSSLKERLRHALGSARHKCKKEGIPFDIDLNYLEELIEEQNKLCFYTKEPLSEEVGNNGVSIDRNDPSKGAGLSTT